jgi:CheY-like chemotaxis protein
MRDSSPTPIDILLVDDSPSDVMIAREALALAKLLNPVHVVTDGDEALDFLYRRGKHTQAPRPAYILLDLNLPKRSGHEVLAIVKADENLKSIPVIVLTTSRAHTDVTKAYDSHANCYITKPVDFDQLAHVVQATQNYWFQIVSLPETTGAEQADDRTSNNS